MFLPMFLVLVPAVVAPAHAALSTAQLDSVAVSPPPGARVDPALSARDAHGRTRTLAAVFGGRAAFVNFVDYTCTTLCGTDLALLSQAVMKSRLDRSRYRIVVIGIDPKDNAQAALAMERKEIPAALWPETVLLLPNQKVVRRATAALGFHFVYDPAIDQFAHPAVIYVVGPDGALRRVLSPLALHIANLRGLLQSSTPQPDLFERIRLLCYAYDPATGLYTLRVLTLLKFACIVTVLMLVGALIVLRRFRRHRAA
jgi:protein SCO1/2